jgi:hypothetical protein
MSLVCEIEIKGLKMKKKLIFLIIFVLIFIVNGKANEAIPINLVSFDDSSSIGEIQKIEANINLASEYEQNKRNVLEPITMLTLGAVLVGLAGFGRKKFKK